MLDLGTFRRVERATGGFETTVWRLERDGREYALRVFRAEQIDTLRRELVALEAARGGGVPVPRVLAIGTYQQRPALLTDWCMGRPLLVELRARPTLVLALGAQFGRGQAAMHRIAAPPALRLNWIAWAGPLQPGLVAHLERLTRVRRTRLLHLAEPSNAPCACCWRWAGASATVWHRATWRRSTRGRVGLCCTTWRAGPARPSSDTCVGGPPAGSGECLISL